MFVYMNIDGCGYSCSKDVYLEMRWTFCSNNNDNNSCCHILPPLLLFLCVVLILVCFFFSFYFKWCVYRKREYCLIVHGYIYFSYLSLLFFFTVEVVIFLCVISFHCIIYICFFILKNSWVKTIFFFFIAFCVCVTLPFPDFFLMTKKRSTFFTKQIKRRSFFL